MEKSFKAESLLGKEIKSYPLYLSAKDMQLYALAINFNQDPLRTEDFRFTYENSSDFQSFPTLGSAMSNAHFEDVLQVEGMPAFDMINGLHGEEDLTVHKPLVPDQ